MRIRLHILLIFAMPMQSMAQDRNSSVSDSSSQQSQMPQLSRSSYSIQAGIDRNTYASAFYYLPGYPSCSPLITTGGGWGQNIMAAYSYLPFENWQLSLGTGFGASSGTMSVDELSSININGIATPATFHHAVDFSLNKLTLIPSIGYELIHGFNLSVGSDFSYILGTSFSSREEITEPVGRGVFDDNGMRTRDVYSGALPALARIQFGIDFSARYLLPMKRNRTLNLAPSLSYRIGITNLLKDIEWKERGITASIGLLYWPELPVQPPPSPINPPVIRVDTTPRSPALLASLHVSGVGQDGIEDPIVRLKVEEVSETEFEPFVPYVFFDSLSSTLPTRYERLVHEQTNQFSISKLPGGDALRVYHHILNIIGKRMITVDTTSHLIVTGCNDGVEGKANPSISRLRAESIRDYLTTTWHVRSNRILVQTRDLPSLPSPVTDSDGIAENRRVELSSTSPLLVSPVVTADTVRFGEPPTIRIRPSVKSEGGIKDWTLRTEQNGQILKTFAGQDSIPARIDWTLAKDERSIPRAPGTLQVKLVVADRSGQRTEAVSEIPVVQQTLESKRRQIADNAEIEKYTVLLFDFNSSELSKDHSDLIRFIKSRIQKNSIVAIAGYGDRIGTPEYNHTLALSRARSVCRALNLPESSIVTTDAKTYLYNNDLPEGRFYSRTVEISIRTPLADGN